MKDGVLEALLDGTLANAADEDTEKTKTTKHEKLRVTCKTFKNLEVTREVVEKLYAVLFGSKPAKGEGKGGSKPLLSLYRPETDELLQPNPEEAPVNVENVSYAENFNPEGEETGV